MEEEKFIRGKTEVPNQVSAYLLEKSLGRAGKCEIVL